MTVVGYCEIDYTVCGLNFRGYFYAKAYRDIITGKRKLILTELPLYKKSRGYTLERAIECLERGIPLLVSVRFGSSRSGEHIVEKIDSLLDREIYVVNEITPFKTEISNIRWDEDLPFGKVTYYASVYEYVNGVLRIEPKETIFLSTLRQLVKENKAELHEETGDSWIFIVKDEEVAEKIRNSDANWYYLDDDNNTIYVEKFKVPERVLANNYVFNLY